MKRAILITLGVFSIGGLAAFAVTPNLIPSEPDPLPVESLVKFPEDLVTLPAADFELPTIEKPEPEPEPEPTPEPEPEPEPIYEEPVQQAPPAYTGGGSKSEWMAAAGIPEDQWGAVDLLISRESSWDPNAVNQSSGACGLVQALPCSKIPGNWNNPVDALTWGNSYVNSRYGGWTQALEHSNAVGWY